VLLQNLKNIFHWYEALLAACYFGFPGRKLIVIGVTGTDGKTTTTHLIHHILKTAGLKSALISSVFAEIGGKQYDTGFHVTTPNAWALQRFLAQSVAAGDKYLVLEVTSHGLDQNRVSWIDFFIGVITNVTHEHLDYHKTYEHYLSTKAKLLKKAKIAIINRDDESFTFIDSRLRGNDRKVSENDRKVTDYAIKNGKADVTPQKFSFTTSLPGEYNQYNCLAAIATALVLDVADKDIKKALINFSGVPGRFERISTKYGFEVIIDFAHTPNALAHVLPTVKAQTKGKLIHVFGCAAERDVAKRPLMGEISAQYADFIILTEEDYRNESIDAINKQIASGARKKGAIALKLADYILDKKYRKPLLFQIPNRQDALNFAVSIAKRGDVIVTTGKAHEKSLCRGNVEYPWDEHKAIDVALRLKR